MAQIDRVETAMAQTSLDVLAAPAGQLEFTIREYDDTLAATFRDINVAWINAMFRLGAIDEDVLNHPRERIIDAGGMVLFVEARGLGIVGACALLRSEPGNAFELTKMGVRESARGLKAGEFLLHAAIDRALSLHADPLYLLTNQRCAAAIHLYEKLGFQHDQQIMAAYGAHYERCDVAMRYALRRVDAQNRQVMSPCDMQLMNDRDIEG